MMFGCVKKCLRGFFSVDGRNFQVEVNISKGVVDLCGIFVKRRNFSTIFLLFKGGFHIK